MEYYLHATFEGQYHIYRLVTLPKQAENAIVSIETVPGLDLEICGIHYQSD